MNRESIELALNLVNKDILGGLQDEQQTDLVDNLWDVLRNLVDEVKDEIKEELRIEMFMELNALREEFSKNQTSGSATPIATEELVKLPASFAALSQGLDNLPGLNELNVKPVDPDYESRIANCRAYQLADASLKRLERDRELSNNTSNNVSNNKLTRTEWIAKKAAITSTYSDEESDSTEDIWDKMLSDKLNLNTRTTDM
jgi:hypothetical protein